MSSSTDCELVLENTGQLPVQWLEVSVECLQEFDQVIQWDNEPLQAQLPLKSGESISLPVHLFGAASFLSTSSSQGRVVELRLLLFCTTCKKPKTPCIYCIVMKDFNLVITIVKIFGPLKSLVYKVICKLYQIAT